MKSYQSNPRLCCSACTPLLLFGPNMVSSFLTPQYTVKQVKLTEISFYTIFPILQLYLFLSTHYPSSRLPSLFWSLCPCLIFGRFTHFGLSYLLTSVPAYFFLYYSHLTINLVFDCSIHWIFPERYYTKLWTVNSLSTR
jgi:hypothetical protein